MSVHAYSSTVSFEGCNLASNNAQEGGASYIRTSTSSLRLTNCSFSSNSASNNTSGSNMVNKQLAAFAASPAEGAAHHGGALSMIGSVSELLVESCKFTSNAAQGQVGQQLQS